MQLIPVVYHPDPDGWWADSPKVEGWSAAANTIDELRALVEEGVRFALDDPDDVLIEHVFAYGTAIYANVIYDFPGHQVLMRPMPMPRAGHATSRAAMLQPTG
jgi:predicted RNase H-like HicB family nuclease